MNRFAIVVLLPDDGSQTRIDFVSREFHSLEDITQLMQELEDKVPNWQLVTFCHVEDLPKLMEGPPGSTPI